MGRRIKPLSRTSKKRVRNFFDSIEDREIVSQIRYWRKKIPKTVQEVKNRWVFAYTSVHTSWEKNVAQYNLLKDQSLSSLSAIKYKLILSRGGMQNMKSDGLFHFGLQWQRHKEMFTELPTCIRTLRNDLTKDLIQINYAKVLFRNWKWNSTEKRVFEHFVSRRPAKKPVKGTDFLVERLS